MIHVAERFAGAALASELVDPDALQPNLAQALVSLFVAVR
jgi:hypothetical protein